MLVLGIFVSYAPPTLSIGAFLVLLCCCTVDIVLCFRSHSRSSTSSVIVAGRGTAMSMSSDSTSSRRQQILADLEEASKPLLDKEFVAKTVAAWKRPMPQEYVNQPLVLVGPSGVGKGRLVKSLLRDYTKYFGKVVTHTTRKPRPDEVNGTHYHFVDKETFDGHCLSSACFFLEHAQVHNNHYGVSRAAWESVVKQRKIPIFEVDVQGATTIKSLGTTSSGSQDLGVFEPKFVFLSPNNLEMLRSRLVLRGTESTEEITLRIANAQKELQFVRENPSFFDYELVNDDFSETSNSFFRLSRDEYRWLPSAAKMQMLLRRIEKVKKLKSELAAFDAAKDTEEGEPL